MLPGNECVSQVAWPTRLTRVGAWVKASLQCLATFLIIGCVGTLAYTGYAKLLHAGGLALPPWQQALAWYGTGLACAFFWPIYYHRGMKGLWLESLPHLLFVAAGGPLALLLAFPL